MAAFVTGSSPLPAAKLSGAKLSPQLSSAKLMAPEAEVGTSLSDRGGLQLSSSYGFIRVGM
jgi:hypothetical protein